LNRRNIEKICREREGREDRGVGEEREMRRRRGGQEEGAHHRAVKFASKNNVRPFFLETDLQESLTFQSSSILRRHFQSL
jgi:hypothetical protein